MEAKEIILALPRLLLPWYSAHRRDLPWRQDREPYHIWVSEIMLQQTRVEAVRGYYSRFLEAFSTVADLANADDERLHKLWEGLGYYSRVRNMKKAAIQIMELYDGNFPREYHRVLALPGIGEYTAGAICSIAFHEKTPAVDGNVLRLVTRLTDDASPIDAQTYKKQVRQLLEEAYPEQAGDFTQALMELGATVCGPNRMPDCENCPCRDICLGRARGTAKELPVKGAKKPRRQEEMTVLILSCDGFYALQKRPNQGLLADLWEFPNIPGKRELPEIVSLVEGKGLKPKEILMQVEKKHIFTHVQWHMNGVYMNVGNRTEDYIWFTREQIHQQTALPTAFRQFWEVLADV